MTNNKNLNTPSDRVDVTPPVPPVVETPIVKTPETVEIAKPIETATPEDAPATSENVDVFIKGLEQSEQLLKDNLKKIESSFIDIGKTVLDSGVFVDEEYTAVSELFGNSFNRYEEISTIINAQIEQMKKLGEAHIKDEFPLKNLMEKVSSLESKLAAYQAKNKSLLDSLLKIKEVLPDKVADSKAEYERIVKQALKAMNDFSLSYLNTLDIDSVPAEEKERLNIIFNVYDNASFADVSESFMRADDYYMSEAENLKNQEQSLLELYQKDKALEDSKPQARSLIDENLRSLFLLKDLFDLNPEMYKKVILNFQLLDEYKDNLKDLQPYLKMETGYYDLNFLKKRVLDLAKDDPGMILEYLDYKLEDLQNAYNQLLSDRKKDRPVGVVDKVIVGEGAEEVSGVSRMEKAAREISQMASGEFSINAEAAARDYDDMVMREKFPNKMKVEVGEDADIVDEVVELKPEDIEYVDEVATLPAKPKYQMPPLPVTETVKQEEAKSAEGKAEIAEVIKELKNIELQRQFVENFWKNNKELADKLRYYQIMYRELKNLADARAGKPVLDDMGANLLSNLNSYIKDNYGKKSEAEIIGDVAKLLEDNDEKLDDLYNMFVESKTISGELNVAPVEQTPAPEMAKVAVGEGAKVKQSPEGSELLLKKMIADAKSFDELAEMIQKKQIMIQGSEKLYKTEDLLASINAAKSGIAPNLWMATRAHGFREKLKSLYDAQHAKTSGEEVIELRDEDVEEITENKPVKVTPPPLPPRFQKLKEPEPISLTEDMKKKSEPEPISLTADMMKKKPVEPEPISLTKDMKKKTVAETPDWRTEAIVDAADRAPELTVLANKLGEKYRDQKANLIDISAIYTDLSESLDDPENLAIAQAWFAETLGMKVNKEKILNYFLDEIVGLGNIKDTYKASRKLFSGNVASFNFRNAVDLALAHANDFVDQLNIWQETVYNTNRRPAPQIAKVKFPTLLH